MKRIRLASVVGVMGLAACVVVFVGDLEITWSVEGATNKADCAKYGVDKWYFVLSGSGHADETATVVCGDTWTTGVAFHNVEEGNYSVNASALDASDALVGRALTKSATVIDDGTGAWTVSFNFSAADLTSTGPVCGDGKCESPETATTCATDCTAAPVCGDGKCEAPEDATSCAKDCTTATASLIVSWKINGTKDGVATGPSWDTCAEVNATSVKITLDGNSKSYPCADNSQSAAIPDLTAGAHTVAISLLDSTGKALTTEAKDTLTASASPTQEAFDFPFNSFMAPMKTGTKGDYLFETLYGGKKCSATLPQVGSQVTLLKLDGTPLIANVCLPGNSSCSKTDGASFGICSEGKLTMADLKWGAYKLKIQGTPVGKTDICWETDEKGSSEIDILVGAGKVNPVVQIDLKRISTAGNCQ